MHTPAFLRVLSLVAPLTAGAAFAEGVRPSFKPIEYPPAPAGAVTDDYHGVKVADPYRWLEEYTEQTNAWIDAEAKLTQSWLATIPQRDAIRARLTSIWNYERFGLPFKEAGKYFYTRNDGLQNQSVLFIADSLDATPRVLLDPNTMSADGTVALAGTSVSEDGKYLAYGTAEAGSDWNIWHVRDIATGKDLTDELRWVKFTTASWSKDSKGFYYQRFDAPKNEAEALKGVNEFQKVYYHLVGTPQAQDVLVYERKDQPRWYLGAGVTEDGRYLILGVESGDSVNNALFYRPLATPDAPFVELFNKFDAKYEFVGNDGPTFFIKSDLEAPRGRVWAINVNHPERAAWKELIPQTSDALQSASLVGNRFFCEYLHDGASKIALHDIAGKAMGDVTLPGLCTAGGFGGKRVDMETFYSYSSFAAPGSIYRYDIASGSSSLFRTPKVDFDGSKYETKEVFVTSKDGAKVPLFITMRKGTKLDGTNPTMLYGYGGFNVPITPGFSPMFAGWLELGGIYASACLRGGSEYGETWHEAGMKLTKQNVFDDFIACSEWLIANDYTSTPKLAIHGGSNGGLLVGACMTQRPDLFGACVPAVGVMDMLRFQKFTIGWGWVGDYGSSDDAAQFKALLGYSPFHNLRPGTCYPPTLITTADHDDRVYPAHSFKFAAAAQAAQGCTNPILIRIEQRAGHGAGKPTSKRIDEATDVFAFLTRVLGM